MKSQHPECPFNSHKKFCDYKRIGMGRGTRTHCQYSNPLQCMFYMKWYDSLSDELKALQNHPKPLKTPNKVGQEKAK